jgi:acyl-CoA dehydrogenase-like protein
VTAFALTEEQQAFARRVRAIAAEELRPLAEAGPPGHVNREVRAPRIYEGASEVQRTIIARELYR